MAIPLSVRSAPLVFDTLAAIGVRHYHGGAPAIYTQGRAYLLNGALQLGLTAFEREPAPTSAMGLAVAGEGEGLLWLVVTPREARLALCGRDDPPDLWAGGGRPLAAPDARRLAGVDEQGWYWGAQLEIGPQALTLAGCGAEKPFGMALFKLDLAVPGSYGASFAPADPSAPLRGAALPVFQPVAW